jgi:hypothetical protein
MYCRLRAGIALIVCAAMPAGCGGSGASSPGAPPLQQTIRTGKLKLTLRVPSQQHMMSRLPRLKALYARARHSGGKKAPRFVGLAVTEIDFTLTAWNGGGSPPSGYDATVYTKPGGYTASNCTSSYYGYSCTVQFSAPAATDTYNVAAKWCSAPNTDGSCPGAATLTLISEGNFVVDVPPGGTGSAQLTLDPVVGKLAWFDNQSSPFPWANGPNAPVTQTGSYGETYACTASGGCYAPLLNNVADSTTSTPATPAYYNLTLLAEDADGDVIVPATGYGSTYNTPLYLTSAGAVDNITMSCSDAHLQILNSGATTPDPAPVPTPDLANGFTNATYAHANSPVTGQDGTSTSDLNGNTVTVAGNDASYVNFNGGSASYTSSSSATCQATDSSSLSSGSFYVGDDFANLLPAIRRRAGRRD